MLARSARRVVARRTYATLSPAGQNDFTHCVIGGGVVGLAIARQLARRENTSTVLLERHGAVGTETSSRSSEVIHAGLYYPKDSLKTRLCIRGSEMLYELCRKHRIPHRNTGKWLVAQKKSQLSTLSGIYAHAISLGIPMNWPVSFETGEREPHVRAAAGILESPRTGIVDSHALMQYLLGAFEELGGDVAYNTAVTSLSRLPSGGYRIGATTPTDEGGVEVTADTVINSAGHGAVAIQNLLLPPERHRKAYYCKGTYFSYSAPTPRVNTLIYPAPVKGLGGLGTHLTLDISGRMRFGPDVEWVDREDDLVPSTERIELAKQAIRQYLRGFKEEALAVDYCGVRPKIAPPEAGGVGQVDFVIREEEGCKGFVNLLGIESPGLTSSLAIAEEVEKILYG